MNNPTIKTPEIELAEVREYEEQIFNLTITI